MTRQEIVDSLVASGHGENILRCPTGVIKVGAFTDWLRPIMLTGSNDKIMLCDKPSFDSIVDLCVSTQHGYSSLNWPEIFTPFGRIKLNPDMDTEGIRIIDAHAFSCGRLIAQSQGVSDTILEIVI